MNGRRKLIVVLGAGASVELGMPSVSQIDSLFHTWAGSDTALATVRSPNIFGFIRDQINCYYSNNRSPLRETNYEEVLYFILLLSSALEDRNFIFTINAFLSLRDFPAIMSCYGERPVNRNDLMELGSLLVDSLINEFRQRCLNVDQHSTYFNSFRNFIRCLRQDFDVAFISLNYDNLVTQACAELFTGFDPETGFFHPERVCERSDWDLIYQIHGSVYFDMLGANLDMHRIRRNADLSGRFSQNSSGRNFQYTPEGIPLPTSVIVAGYGKSFQIQRLPFRTYYSQLDRMVQQSDAFLFIGYGFGDLHLNNCFHDVRRGPVARPVVVITYSNDNEDDMDRWYRNLWTAVPYNGFEMGRRNHSATPFIAELIENREFEVSRNPSYPLAIWHGGFMEACNHYNLIRDELNL